jgi:hypothetical protein
MVLAHLGSYKYNNSNASHNHSTGQFIESTLGIEPYPTSTLHQMPSPHLHDINEIFP